jgi:hypothetical protein
VGAWTFVLGLAVYLVGLATHEVMHLVALYAVGGSGSLIVRGWRFTFLPLTVYSLHAQPLVPLPFASHLIFDVGGPGLAILLFGLLTLAVKEGMARTVLVANLFILGFYAVIEPLDVLLEGAVRDAPFLTWAEFNYGVPLLILLATSWRVSRRAPA